MKCTMISTAILALFATAPAIAAPVFSEDFSGATPGFGYVGQVPGAKFVSSGEVDIVGVLNGTFFDCGSLNPGGNCMDTIGGRGPGGTITSTSFDLVAGTSYTLSFRDAYSGSVAGSVATYTATVGGFTKLFTVGAGVEDESFSFTPTASVTTQLTYDILTSPTSISNGVVVADIRIDSTLVPGAVPEPASWVMFVGGFGLLGVAMRQRRRANVNFA